MNRDLRFLNNSFDTHTISRVQSCVKAVIDFAAEMFLMRSLYLVRTNKEIFSFFLSFLSPPPTPWFSPATAVHDLHREALLL